MYHQFDVDIAVKYGVNAAVLLNNIFHWCQKNKANNKNFHDGLYWTYNSRAAFAELFPYLSERQIKTALDKLIEDGVIVTGDYNNERWKRPTWYAVTKRGFSLLQNSSPDGAEMSERRDGNVISTITDINTDKKTTDINTNESKRKRFIPPTADEVRAYAKEKGFSIDAERFVNFYESKGWKVGSSPMKDWRASVRNWASRDREQTSTTSPTSAPTVYTDPDYENYW